MLLTDHLLLNYKRCNRRTYLEIYGNPQQKDPEKDFLLKLKRENQTHIHNILRSRSYNYQQPEVSRRDWQLNSEQTLALMEQGVDCIVRGMLSLTFTQWQSAINNNSCLELCLRESQNESAILLKELIFVAAPTILIKQSGHSKFGNWEYMPVNIKLGRRAKPEYKLIAAFHAQMLAAIQGVVPLKSQLILRELPDHYINLQDWLPKMQQSVAECFEMLTNKLEPEVFISRQRCSLCHWYNYCYDIAQSVEHLSLIPGITPKRYEYLKEIGVDNLDAFANIPESDLKEIMGEDVACQLKQQVDSLKSERAIVRSSFDLINQQPIPTGAIELYFDIEAEPERQIDYLLGVLLVDRSANTEKFVPFLAERPEEEAKIWQQFLDFTAFYPDAPIFHYSEYEVDTIKRLGKLYRTPYRIIKELLSRFVDLHEWVTESVVLPVESYSLKSLANWLGFYWRETEGSGDQSVCWYDQWLITENTSLLNLILSYNEDDCRATRYLKDWLLDFLESQRNLKISSIRQDKPHLASK